MAVSIIISAYNTEKYLPAALESVLSQSVKDWEAIIVNDGSSDQTGTIAETFSRLDSRIRVLHQENSGIAQARNRGLAEVRADYDYCLFLDSDDLLEPDALEILLQALKKDPQAVGAHGLCRYIDSEGKPLAVGGSCIHPLRRRGIQGKLLKVWPVSAPTTFAVLAYAPGFVFTSGLMVRRAPKEAAGDFDPSLKIAEDWHMWLRLSRLGHLACVNRVTFSYRRHEGNITNRRGLMRESIFEVRKKMYVSADLHESEKRIILLGYRYYELYRARVQFSYAAGKLSQGRMIDAFKDFRLAMRHILSSMKRVGSIFK